MLLTLSDSRDQFQIQINTFPNDGFQLSLSEWNGEDFITHSDKRYIDYTMYEAAIQALMAAQVDEARAYEIAADMGMLS